MCGIVGYTGFREAETILIEGLRRLEYRGYDSAGIVTQTGPTLHIRKKAGRCVWEKYIEALYPQERPVPVRIWEIHR